MSILRTAAEIEHMHRSTSYISGASPLVGRVLAHEDRFGDGAPSWPNAPSSTDTAKTRQRHVKRLRRFANDFPGADQLADIIESCEPGHRCTSGACPECGRAFQRWFVEQVSSLTADADPQHLFSISLALAKQRTAEHQLHTLHTAGIKRALPYTLGKATGLAWVAGGIDLSLNDDTQKGSDIGWQPQFYGLALTSDLSCLSDVLRCRYQRTTYAPRPVQIKESDGRAEAFSYAFKTDFVQRTAYKDPQNRSNTRKTYLRPKNHVQAMLWMHQSGFSDRLYLKGIRMTRVGDNVRLATVKRLE